MGRLSQVEKGVQSFSNMERDFASGKLFNNVRR